MRRRLTLGIALIFLTGCARSLPAQPPEEVRPTCSEGHGLVEVSNTVPHEPGGYCGNIQTTVTYPYQGPQEWSASFMFGPSVELTDLLRWLDYSRPICRCLPEYRVDTEFGTDYGINLSQGYVRHGEGQADLTSEQVEQLRQLLDRDKLESSGG